MAMPIRNLFELAEELDRRRFTGAPGLLGFFLFDERRSHEAILEFARREYEWLNALAAANRMCLFFFLPDAELDAYANPDESIFMEFGRDKPKNPSLEVARAFGLGADDLPGVIFFTELDIATPGTNEGVYWALSAELFREDAGDAEARLSEVFGAVQDARADSTDLESLLAGLRELAESEAGVKPARRGRLRKSSGVKQVASRGVLIEVANLAVVQGLGI